MTPQIRFFREIYRRLVTSVNGWGSMLEGEFHQRLYPGWFGPETMADFALPMGSFGAFELNKRERRMSHVEIEFYANEVAEERIDQIGSEPARLDFTGRSAVAPSNGAVRSASFEKDKKVLAKLEDGDLLRQFQDGNEQAFYVLYERRNREIFTHCLRMCSQDYEKANDAFQDTFVKVYTRKDLFTDTANGRAWLYRIATNTCLNQIRYDKRHPKEGLDETVSSVDPKMQPDFQTGQNYLKEALERAIAKLPMELKEPFLLRELEEFSYEEVAEQLGLTVAACRQRVYRAKQALREQLEEAATGETEVRKKKSWNPFAK